MAQSWSGRVVKIVGGCQIAGWDLQCGRRRQLDIGGNGPHAVSRFICSVITFDVSGEGWGEFRSREFEIRKVLLNRC